MRGIDIIEAMENIDERLILDAKRHKKAAPPWLRFVSLAALFCCVLLLGLLAVNRILAPGEENVPDTLSPTEESNWEKSAQEDFAASEDDYFSSDTPLKYELPASLTEEACIEFSEDGKTMTFFDPLTRAHLGYGGKIWRINIYTQEEFHRLDHQYDELLDNGWYGHMDPSGYMYAQDEGCVYVLNTPTDLQYDPNDSESNASYLKYMEAGLEILESIIDHNDLTVNPNWNEEIVKELFPELYADTISSQWHSMFSYCTVYTSEENRINNLQIACDAINGAILKSGEAFSFNDVVGERSAAKGYKEAAVYTTGDEELVLGGGISQVASTLYYCCLYADLEILERQGQVYHDPFIPGGMDAAVYWGSVDFQFRNSTDHDIRIDAYLSEGSLWVELLATEEPDFTVDITQERRESDTDLTYKITRNVYDLDGNLIRTDTTEDLDALGGLGTTTYALRGIAATAPTETE